MSSSSRAPHAASAPEVFFGPPGKAERKSLAPLQFAAVRRAAFRARSTLARCSARARPAWRLRQAGKFTVSAGEQLCRPGASPRFCRAPRRSRPSGPGGRQSRLELERRLAQLGSLLPQQGRFLGIPGGCGDVGAFQEVGETAPREADDLGQVGGCKGHKVKSALARLFPHAPRPRVFGKRDTVRAKSIVGTPRGRPARVALPPPLR